MGLREYQRRKAGTKAAYPTPFDWIKQTDIGLETELSPLTWDRNDSDVTPLTNKIRRLMCFCYLRLF